MTHLSYKFKKNIAKGESQKRLFDKNDNHC